MKHKLYGMAAAVAGILLGTAGLVVAFVHLSRPGYSFNVDAVVIISSSILLGCGLIAVAIATK